MKKIMSIMLLAVFMLAMAAPAFAASGSYGSALGTSLAAGSRIISSEVKKEQTGSATVTPSIQTNGPKVWYRCRVGTNSADMATEAKSYTSKPSSVSLPYLSGYGYVNNTYRLAVQNDSESTANVRVKGDWIP